VRAVGYQKASMLFHMLYTSLGEEVFNASLRDFYNRMRHKRAAWEDLQTSFENRSNSSLADFFDQWLKRADVPMLRINDLAIREKNGQPLLSFTLVQKNKKAYELIVPVTIVLPDREVRKIIQTSTSKKEVQIPLADLPSKMVIDPDYDLMRVLSPDELPPVWSRFAGAPKKLAILATDAKDDVFSPLIEMLETIDCETVLSDEADDSDISGASVIFLGPTSELALSLFARPEHNKVGMTVDVRKNPLNHSEVAILVSADDPQEVAPAARKLKHYGKYSSLVFKNGRISEKKITDTDSGQNYSLDVPPKGIEVGKALDFDDIITELSKKRVVYVGESHTDYADHLLQLRVIHELYKKNPNLAIGMEMFTHPAQDALDRFISRQTDEKTFLKESHYYKIWRFDYRLYRDIINFARRHQVPIVALNLERDIVSTVFKNGGIAALTPEQQEMLPAERDLDMPGYQDRISRVYKMHGGHQENGGGQFKDFLQSQALWDETMAETIAEYLKAHPEENMIVLAGQGHVMKDSAIPPRVARRIPVQQAVVVNAAHIDIDPALADYSIFTSPAHLPAAAIMGVLLDGKDDGVAIKAVTPKGRAKAAGIRKNDILVAIDNEPIATVEDVKAIMLDKKKGQRLTVRIKRPRAIFADEELEIEIVL
ncbi:MAG: ChaN family lipoprotein, partial [Desulfobulbaceae bacterium]|nr:ChaN family lipoprotein [Desulfobulbaceae bacterium]